MSEWKREYECLRSVGRHEETTLDLGRVDGDLEVEIRCRDSGHGHCCPHRAYIPVALLREWLAEREESAKKANTDA